MSTKGKKPEFKKIKTNSVPESPEDLSFPLLPPSVEGNPERQGDQFHVQPESLIFDIDAVISELVFTGDIPGGRHRFGPDRSTRASPGVSPHNPGSAPAGHFRRPPEP